jgi:hypothetical protein
LQKGRGGGVSYAYGFAYLKSCINRILIKKKKRKKEKKKNNKLFLIRNLKGNWVRRTIEEKRKIPLKEKSRIHAFFRQH